MLIKALNRSDSEGIFVSVINAAGSTLTNGAFLCYDWRNASSHGVAVIQPTTSTLGLFAGVLAHKAPNYADLPSNSYGLVQIFGVHGSVLYNVGGASLSAAGQWLIPMNAQYSGQTVRISGLGLSWTSEVHLISRGAFLMSNDLSGSSWGQAFVRGI